jgi:hypothetical protein
MPEKTKLQKAGLKKVEFFDLICSRVAISKISGPIILINAPGTIRRLGALAIHGIFQVLSQEFTVEQKIFRIDKDIAGLYQAIKLGYKNILYTGSSASVQKLLSKINTP